MIDPKTTTDFLYYVTLYKLDKALWNKPTTPNYPLASPSAEAMAQMQADVMKAFAENDAKKCHQLLWKLSLRLEEETSEKLVFREESVGVFLHYDIAESYCVEFADDWDECGMYNLASIQRCPPGLLHRRRPKREDFTFFTIDDGGKGYRGAGVELVGVKIPHPERFAGHLWQDPRKPEST